MWGSRAFHPASSLSGEIIYPKHIWYLKHQGMKGTGTLMAQTTFSWCIPHLSMAQETVSASQGHQALPLLVMDLAGWDPCPWTNKPAWPWPIPIPWKVPGARAAWLSGCGVRNGPVGMSPEEGMIRAWNISLMRKDWESWGCSTWRKLLRDLIAPFST